MEANQQFTETPYLERAQLAFQVGCVAHGGLGGWACLHEGASLTSFWLIEAASVVEGLRLVLHQLSWYFYIHMERGDRLEMGDVTEDTYNADSLLWN